MMTIRRASERGHANHGWLDAHHTFSFASYYDPKFMGFGPLRVLNQDLVAPSTGFETHGHKDMEIVTYVLEGVLEHKDSMGNGSQICPGEVQLMSAGQGVTHSEFNGSDAESLHLLQMWVQPKSLGTIPRYEQKAFARKDVLGKLCLVVSPSGKDGSLAIDQDANLHVGVIRSKDETYLFVLPNRMVWIHVARGRVRINGEDFDAGDGAAIRNENRMDFYGYDDADVVIWDFAT